MSSVAPYLVGTSFEQFSSYTPKEALTSLEKWAKIRVTKEAENESPEKRAK